MAINIVYNLWELNKMKQNKTNTNKTKKNIKVFYMFFWWWLNSSFILVWTLYRNFSLAILQLRHLIAKRKNCNNKLNLQKYFVFFKEALLNESIYIYIYIYIFSIYMLDIHTHTHTHTHTHIYIYIYICLLIWISFQYFKVYCGIVDKDNKKSPQ